MNRKKKMVEWSSEAEIYLDLFCKKPSYASLARFMLSFSCTGDCSNCGAREDRIARKCKFVNLFSSHALESERVGPRQVETVDMTNVRAYHKMVVRDRYFEAESYGPFCTRQYRGRLGKVLLDAIQLKEFLSMSREAKLFKEV